VLAIPTLPQQPIGRFTILLYSVVDSRRQKKANGIWEWLFIIGGSNDASFENVVGPKSNPLGGKMVKLLVRDKESIQEAVRRFRKLVERSGIKKEMRRREYYEKPSEINRRSRLRAERRQKRTRTILGN